MANLKFSPKEAIAEAANNILKAIMLANGSEEQMASLFGDTLSGIIKGFNIEKRQSIRNGLDVAIERAWIDIISQKEFEGLKEECKNTLKQNVVSSQNVFEALNTDDPECVLRCKIIPILKLYTNWNIIDVNDYARFAAEQLLIAINNEMETDGILSLLQEIDNLHKDIYSKIDTLEEVNLVLNQKVIKKLDSIWAVVSSSAGNNTVYESIPGRFWNAGKMWYEEARKPGARFHSLDIVNKILPSAEDKPAESEYSFSFRATDTNENAIQCSRFSELLRDKNSVYHRGHFMLIGEGGIGKTTTLMSAMQDSYKEKESYKGESVIPLFVELSLAPDSQDSHAYDGISSSVIHRLIYAMLQEKDSKKDHTDFLRECMNEESSIAKDTVRTLLTSVAGDETRYVLLIDGLNEVSSEPFTGRRSSAQGRILQEIKEIIERYSNVTVILTGRQGAFIGHPFFSLFYLRGLVWDEIADYLREKGKTDEEISLIRNGDKGLLKVLSIPMFLTMYVLLHDTDGITTRGELLKIFFHERFERRKNECTLHRQSDISERIDRDEEQSVSGKMTRGNITLPIQWMFLDILIPEMAAKMKASYSYHISEDKVCLLLESLFISPDSLYCGQYKKYATYCFKRRLNGENLKSIITSFTKAYDQDEESYGAAFLNYCESSLGILYREGEGSFGFVHQHFRDYFAAVCNVNRMKIAYAALQKDDPVSARIIMQQYDIEPLDPILMVYIGEYLGEHHNVLHYSESVEDSSETDVTEECLRERQLISNLFNIYRGVAQENAYGVYNLVEILKRVRKDLSGSDFHNLDLRRCHFYNTPLDSLSNTDFSDSIINAKNWLSEGHSGKIRTFVINQNDSFIVTASDDCTARIWDIHSGELLSTLEGHSGRVTAVAVSRTSKYIITGADDCTARIWDTETGKCLHQLSWHKSRVNAVDFSPDDSLVVTASSDTTACIWDVKTGQLRASLFVHNGKINHIAFSHSKNYVVTASSDHTFCIWNATDGKLVHLIKGHFRGINTAFFNQNDSLIVTASDDLTACIWNANTGELIHTLSGHTHRVRFADFSVDSKYVVTASSDKSARIWDVETGKLVHSLVGHSLRVNTAVFSPNGKYVVTASDDKSARIWDICSGMSLFQLLGHSRRVNCAVFSTDGNLVVTVSSDKSARIWDVRTGSLLHILEGYSGWVNSAVFNCDGSLIATAFGDKNARIWDTYKGSLLFQLTGHSNWINSTVFSSDGKKIITASDDKSARIWNASTGIQLCSLDGHTGWISSAVFSNDNNMVVTASSDHTARIWDVHTGKCLHLLKGHTGRVNSATFNSTNDLIATVFYEKVVRIWDANDGRLLFQLRKHTGRVNSAVFSHDGNIIVTASDDKSACIWNARTGKLLKHLRGHSNWVNYASISPNGSHIVTASSDHTARIWDTDTGALQHVLTGHSDWVNYVAFSHNGNYVVTASSDHTARIWNAQTGICLFELKGHSNWVKSAVFSPDDNYIVTASDDKTARVWDGTNGHLIHILYEIPGLYVNLVNFENVSSKSVITETQKQIFRQYGAII